jgi:hypothetical protein
MVANTPAAGAQAPAGPLQVPDFQIIPRKGLWLVAITIAGLLVAIVADNLWALRFFHIAGGALWTGIDLFLGLLLAPILRTMPPASRLAINTRLMPMMLLIMPTLVIATLTSGWQLGVLLGMVHSDFYLHGWMVASYIVVGVMVVIALAVLTPSNVAVLFELKKPRPNPEVIGRLSQRFLYTAGITGLMQVATLVIMTKISY